MKTFLLIIFLALFTTISFAQKSSNTIVLSGGKSWHGTGDLNGIIAEVSFDHNLKKRLLLSTGIATTINYGKDRGFNGYAAGTSPQDNLLKFTTAGIQLNSIMNYALLGSGSDQLRIGGGALLRFQSSSFPSVYGYTQDPNVYPLPFYTFNDRENQNTFSIGYTFGLSFHTKLSSKFETGIKAFFQNDTNGDAISSISLLFGRSVR